MSAKTGFLARLFGRAQRQRGFSAVTVAAMVAAGLGGVAATLVVSTSSASAGTPPPAPSGWTTLFSDSFAGGAGSAPNTGNWKYDTGTGFGTGEIENMTTSTANCSVDGNGDLKLTAINSGGSWTSCRLESNAVWQDPAGGQFEMLASVEQPNPPNGMGYWPAFWSLGGDFRTGVGWPTSGELDMMEDVNALNESSQTMHDSSGSPGHGLIACPTVGCQNGFNTYGVIINRVNTSAEYLQFIMDGVVESTITEASVGTTAWQDAVDHGFFILWDLAMGGNYPNGVCGCTTPTSSTSSGYSMLANWVAVYSTSGGGGATTTTAPATTTTNVSGSNCSASASGTALSRAGWAPSTNTAAAGADVASNAIDGNLSTRFSSDAAQAAGQYWQANLGSAQSFNELQMAVPNSAGDYARAYQVQVSSNGSSWSTVASCTGTGTPETVSFTPQSAQYVRVTLTGSGGTTNWWSIDELNLYSNGSATTTTAPTTTTAGGGGANCSGPTSGENQLARSGWAASTNTAASGADVASNAIDANLSTRFSSDAAQAAGQYWQASLGSTQSFNELDMEVPNSAGDYARAFSVGVSTNGSSFTTVATCTGTSASEVVSFPAQSASYVRVTLTGAGGTTNWWSIDELYLGTNGSATTTAPTTTTTAAAANCSAAVSGSALSHSGWVASTNAPSVTNDQPSNAIDGNLSTRYSSDEDQAAGIYWEANMGSAKTFHILQMQVPNSTGDYARGYSVQVSANGSSWATVATCTGAGATETVSFASQTDQYVRVVLTTAVSTNWWSVDELNLY